MNTTGTASAHAGWHPDPYDQSALRWWDGARWTEHVHRPGGAAQPGASAAYGAQQSATAYGSSGGDYAAYGSGAYPASNQQYDSYYTQPAKSSRGESSLTSQNSFSFGTLITVAIYFGIAMTTGIVLLGILPAWFAYNAFQRREALAPLAALAAAGAIAFAVMNW